MNQYNQLDRLIKKYVIVIGVIALLLLNLTGLQQFFGLLFKVLMPIVLGFMLAYVVNILMRRIEKMYFPSSQSKWINKTRRPFSLLLSFILIFVVIYFVMSMILPQLYSVAVEVTAAIPIWTETVKNWILSYQDRFPEIEKLVQQADLQFNKIAENLWGMANDFTSNFVQKTLFTINSLFSLIVNGILSLMISLYVLISKESLLTQFKRSMKALLPDKYYYLLRYVVHTLDHSFKHFVTGEVSEAFILGIMVTVGMMIFQFPYAGMIGALTGFTALIPLVGAYISGIIGFLLIVIQSPIQGLMFLIFIIVVQQVEGNLIYPMVVGDSIGLPGLWVLVSITIGGGFFGVWGMLLAVPLASAAYKIFKDYIKMRESYNS